ncbi:MAG: RND transporter [Planctomycetota bacterium]|nr:MAG: RND transporter [Planctomycetota bacterium]
MKRLLSRMCWPPLALLALLALSACNAVGPDYEAPETLLPGSWHAEMVDGIASGEAPLQTWWTVLNDPILEQVIARTQANSLTLEVAYHRVLESRAFYSIAAGDRAPDLNAGANLQRRKFSETQLGTNTGTNDSGSGGVDATWEVDVFGRVRRNVEAADADLAASVEDYRDVLVVLLGDVAEIYVEMRALQQRASYAERNVRDQKATLKLTRDRFNAGLVPGLDVAQAERNLAITEASIPPLLEGVQRAIHRLGVLMGEHPAALQELLEPLGPIPEAPDVLTVNLPADLLRQRPDVRRAERQLAAQSARVGVATAAEYPVFSISGSYRHVSNSSDTWTDSESRSWFFGPDMSWNLFDGGQVQGSIDVADERLLQAMASYEQAVLEALEEVENSLVSYHLESDRRAALERSVDASERTVTLVKTLYDNGVVDFQNVLDAERALTDQQDQLAESEGFVVRNMVSLYRALGGGWDPDDPVLPEEQRLDGEASDELLVEPRDEGAAADADGSMSETNEQPPEDA